MNKETAERYVNEYGKNLYSFCRYCTRDLDAANELYQQTFLVAFEKDELEENANPVSYLITIAVNLWKNRLRKAAWRKKIADVRAGEKKSLRRSQTPGPPWRRK
ncbi:MAG: sigma-70 family RNA polymerase sigma factor [Lachnospiraceae bacterium]|nr:sigma-70 family RNA polymerase sigma factor [Lachnospiraceae bacterium]